MRYRQATALDLFNPPILQPFYVTVPELGLDRAMCFSAGSCANDASNIYIMRVNIDAMEKVIPKSVAPRIFAVQITCDLHEIEVGE